MDKLHNQFLGKPFITTEKSNFSKSVCIRRCQENIRQAKNELVLIRRRETKKVIFYYNPTYYHNINRVFESHVRCKHDTKWEFLFLFHSQQIDFGREKSKLSKTFLRCCVLHVFLLLKRLQNLAGKRDEINQITRDRGFSPSVLVLLWL